MEAAPSHGQWPTCWKAPRKRLATSRTYGTAYADIDVYSGLLDPSLFTRAVIELEQIVSLYGTMATGRYDVDEEEQSDIAELLELVMEDIMVALTSPLSGPLAAGSARSRALEALRDSIKRNLPRAQAQILDRDSREYLQRQQDGNREARRQRRTHLSDVDDCVTPLPAGALLPTEALECIFSQLDPISLGSASSTCRSWRDAATADDLWKPLLRLAYGPKEMEKLAAKGGEGTSTAPADDAPHRSRFLALAAAYPSWLLPWRSKRVLVKGDIKWVGPELWAQLQAEPGWHGVAHTPTLISFITPAHVSNYVWSRGSLLSPHSEWLLRMRARDDDTSESESDGDTGSDSDTDTGSDNDTDEANEA